MCSWNHSYISDVTHTIRLNPITITKSFTNIHLYLIFSALFYIFFFLICLISLINALQRIRCDMCNILNNNWSMSVMKFCFRHSLKCWDIIWRNQHLWKTQSNIPEFLFSARIKIPIRTYFNILFILELKYSNNYWGTFKKK